MSGDNKMNEQRKKRDTMYRGRREIRNKGGKRYKGRRERKERDEEREEI